MSRPEGDERLKNGGGAGSCTRVRKYILAGIYDAYPLLSVAPGVKKRKNRRAPVPENLAATVQDDRLPPACLNDIRSPPAG